MLTVAKAVLYSDFKHLNRDALIEISKDLCLAANGSTYDLIDRIWEKVSKDREGSEETLSKYAHKILAGKTAVTWYHLEHGSTLVGAKQKIVAKAKVLYREWDPFASLLVPGQQEIDTTPRLIAAINGDSEDEYYLRFIYRSGVANHFYGMEKVTTPLSDIITVYIDEQKNCIEVRTDAANAKKFAACVADLIGQRITIEQTEVIGARSCDVEEVAIKLGGIVTDSESRPEKTLEDFTAEQAEAVFKVLSAIDSYFAHEDIVELERELNEAKLLFGVYKEAFTSMILAGLDRIGFRGETDLLNHPLFKYVGPHVQHQGAYIQFKVSEGGLNEVHTIRVGMKSQNITFLTLGTENAIKFVRDHVII